MEVKKLELDKQFVTLDSWIQKLSQNIPLIWLIAYVQRCQKFKRLF
jgi:hypothetical protein